MKNVAFLDIDIFVLFFALFLCLFVLLLFLLTMRMV